MCDFHLVRPLDNIEDMFGEWIKSFPKPQRQLVRCGDLVVCWTLWKTRNDVCFNRIVLNDPANVIYRLCSLLTSWAILQRTQDKRKVKDRAMQLKLVIRETYARSHGWAPTIARITGS
jgi:hypothetical protein